MSSNERMRERQFAQVYGAANSESLQIDILTVETVRGLPRQKPVLSQRLVSLIVKVALRLRFLVRVLPSIFYCQPESSIY
jgi:hypothetical protein